MHALADPQYDTPAGIDRTELSKAFLSLLNLYKLHRIGGQPVDTEAEFMSYIIVSRVRPATAFSSLKRV
jgi:hypothetical protein